MNLDDEALIRWLDGLPGASQDLIRVMLFRARELDLSVAEMAKAACDALELFNALRDAGSGPD